MELKQIINRVVRLLLISTVLLSIWKWFSFDANQLELNGDEVVWILDAEAYSKYVQGEWSFFTVSPDVLTKSWNDQEYRTVDQPQAGKYIFGFLLSAGGKQPWNSDRKSELYASFMRGMLPGGLVQDLNQELGAEVVQAILYMRGMNALFGFAFIVLISILVHKYTRSIEAGLLLFILLVNHPLIIHYSHVAMTDVYAWIFQLLAVVAMVIGFRKINEKKMNEVVVWAVAAGAATALATSIKLNGAFLIFIPYISCLYFSVQVFLKKKTISYIDLRVALVWLGIFLATGGIVFMLLEPYLWSNPIQQGLLLVDARLMQQQRFLRVFNDLSIRQVGRRLVETVSSIDLTVWLVAVVTIAQQKNTFFSKNKMKKTADNNYYEKLSLLIAVSPIILAVFYYGKVDFDRYYIPATIAIYVCLLVSIFTSKSEQKNNAT